ncbi:MAG: MFS transporter [Anaerolineae bacterium]|nr:MFS transporter [Anaerolineae bacterium]
MTVPQREAAAGPETGRRDEARSEAAARQRDLGWAPVVAFMLLHFVGTGAYTPYLQLYFQERGLSPLAIGTLTGVGPALAVIMPVFWGLIGDRSRRARGLLAATSLLAAASFMGLSIGRSFAALLALSALFSAFSLASGPLSTAIVLEEGERLGSGYGPLRMWGSVGFAVGILSAGRLVSELGTGAIFAAYGVPTVLSLVPLVWLREAGLRTGTLTLRAAWQVLSDRRLAALLLVALIWRITSAGYYTFYTIYITDMGAGASLVSIAWALGLVGEVTVLRLSGRLVGRMGISGLLALGLLGSALRWLAYAVAPGPGWTLPFQLLHGLTFGATTTAAVLAVDNLFPTELRSTGQGVLSMAMWGVGGLLGSLAVGALFQSVGPRWMYGASAVGAALTGAAVLVALRFAPSKSGR